jgi:hypothetical protein
MAEEGAPPPTPTAFVDAVLGYQRTAAIRAAVELGLFEAIGSAGADAETIAARVGASPRGVRILCDYLTVLGFLEKSGALWRQAPVARDFIDAASPTSMASVVRFLAGPEFLRLFLEDPAGYVRRGGSDGLANMAPEDPIWVTFAESMTPFTLAAAKATAAHGAAVWGSAQVTLPALEVAPPLVFWGKKEVAIDLWHHAVYAVASGLAYRLIDARS